jgi:hypothetical protein
MGHYIMVYNSGETVDSSEISINDYFMTENYPKDSIRMREITSDLSPEFKEIEN